MEIRVKLFILAAICWGTVAFAVSDPAIYVIPDKDHNDPAVRSQAADTLKQLKHEEPFLDCLFLEWDPGGNSAISDYLQKKRSFADAIGGERTRITNETGNGTSPILEQHLLDTARELGLSVFGVNAKIGSTTWKEADAADAEFEKYISGNLDRAYETAPQEITKRMVDKSTIARSKVMADNVATYFNSGVCHNGAFLVGLGHIQESDHGFPSSPTIQDDLSNHGFRVEVLNLDKSGK